jgi:hypothetical protein
VRIVRQNARFAQSAPFLTGAFAQQAIQVKQAKSAEYDRVLSRLTYRSATITVQAGELVWPFVDLKVLESAGTFRSFESGRNVILSFLH